MMEETKVNDNIGADREGFIFLSYKREDAPAADAIRRGLETVGFDVWFDKDLQCGQKWAYVIDEKLLEASCVVVLWSPKANQSPWVKHEASHSIARGIYAPVRIELVKIDSPFHSVQATDLLGWEDDLEHPGFHDLTNRIKHLMPEKPNFRVRVKRWLRHQKTAVAAIVFGLLALGTLFWLTKQMNETLSQQKTLATQAENTQKATESLALPLKRAQEDIKSQVNQMKSVKGQMDSSLKQSEELSDSMEQTQAGQVQSQKKITAVAKKMDDNLATQERVLSGNDSILDGVKLVAQTSLTTVEKLFEESNRVDPRQVSVTIDYRYVGANTRNTPEILKKAYVSIRVVKNKDFDRRIKLNTWGTSHILPSKLDSLGLGTLQKRTVRQDRYASSMHTAIFSEFTGQSDFFSDGGNWNGAFLEAHLTIYDPKAVQQIKDLYKGKDLKSISPNLSNHYDIPKKYAKNDASITGLPILVECTVHIRGRSIKLTEARKGTKALMAFFKNKKSDPDEAGFVIAKFRIVEIPKDTFPESLEVPEIKPSS